MSGLPYSPTVSSFLRPIFGYFRGSFERDLIEQSAAERLVKAASVAGFALAGNLVGVVVSLPASEIVSFRDLTSS